MLRRMGLVRSDVSEERIASIIRVTRIVELGTTLAITSNPSTLRRNTTLRFSVTANVVPNSSIHVTLMYAIRSSETSVLTRATWRNILEDVVLHSHRRKKAQILQIAICGKATIAAFR
jgi:hypothetical protein